MDAILNQDRIGALEGLLNERYSVRAFLPQEVSREVIEHILTVSQRTASWCNSQPWQVLIASGEARERFRKAIYAEAASGAKDDHDFTPLRRVIQTRDGLQTSAQRLRAPTRRDHDAEGDGHARRWSDPSFSGGGTSSRAGRGGRSRRRTAR